MRLINCKVELKLKRTIFFFFLSAARHDNANDNGNANNIIFTVKDTKLYGPVLTFSPRDNQKFSKLLSKGFEKSVYWNKYKTKSIDNLLNQIFLELIDYLF